MRNLYRQPDANSSHECMLATTQVEMEFTAEHRWFVSSFLRQSVGEIYVTRRQMYVVCAALGWSGSAFVGGFIIDKYGFSIVFYCTAVLQVSRCFVRDA